MSTPMLGEIKMFAGNFAPKGWALCQGQTLSIQQNTALFSILGTTYGGNGQTTFNLPDFRGRVPVSSGQAPGLQLYTLGQQLGAETVTLLTTQIPAHNHIVNAVANGGNQASPASGYPAIESTGTSLNYSNAITNTTMIPTMIGQTGGSQPHNNIQPTLCVNFIIALVGIFPTRS